MGCDPLVVCGTQPHALEVVRVPPHLERVAAGAWRLRVALGIQGRGVVEAPAEPQPRGTDDTPGRVQQRRELLCGDRGRCPSRGGGQRLMTGSWGMCSARGCGRHGSVRPGMDHPCVEHVLDHRGRPSGRVRALPGSGEQMVGEERCEALQRALHTTAVHRPQALRVLHVDPQLGAGFAQHTQAGCVDAVDDEGVRADDRWGRFSSEWAGRASGQDGAPV